MYIVTGGAGMIGSAVIWALNQKGISDILVVDNLASTEKWKNLVGLSYSDYMHRDEFIRRIRENSLDFSSSTSLGVHSGTSAAAASSVSASTSSSAVSGSSAIEGIVHMGACSSTTELDADFLMENNFHYTRELFLFAKKHAIRFVNASSAATYGNGSQGFSNDLELTKKLQPLNMYGYSKQLFDMWCIKNDALNDVVNLKFFNVYGPNEYHKGNMKSVACKAVTQIKETGALQLFASDHTNYEDGGQLRDFIYVKDCAKLILWLLENKQVNGIFNVGTGKARTWNSVATAVFNAMATPVNIKYVPLPEQLRGKYQYFTQADMAWLKTQNCPVSFTSLEEGVGEYVKEYLLKDNPYLVS